MIIIQMFFFIFDTGFTFTPQQIWITFCSWSVWTYSSCCDVMAPWQAKLKKEDLPVSVPHPGHPTWRPRSLTPPQMWRWGSGPWCWLGCPWRTKRRRTLASLAHWGPFASSSLVFWVSWRCPLWPASSLLHCPAKRRRRRLIKRLAWCEFCSSQLKKAVFLFQGFSSHFPFYDH